MTPFEQEVADALRATELSDGIPLAAEDAELLAPRVAAAIRAAADAADNEDRESWDHSQYVALAALRGTQ